MLADETIQSDCSFDFLSGMNTEDSQLPMIPRAEHLMQPAETLFPASTSGLTAPSLYAL